MADTWYFQRLARRGNGWLIHRTIHCKPKRGPILATVEGDKQELSYDDVAKIDNYLWELFGDLDG